MISHVLTALLLAAPAGDAPAPAASPFDQVVAAERAFAAQSLRDGLHAAFFANFAEDGVVFDPTPTPGRAKHEGKPRSKGELSWAPAWAAAAASGEFGLSSGPWQFRIPGDAAPPATGWFFTVWRKQQGGGWKVEADLGVSFASDAPFPVEVENGLSGDPAPSRPARPSDGAKARSKIAAAEHALAVAGAKGLGAAVAARADAGLRVYRDGKPPAAGLEAAKALLAGDARTATCVAQRVAAAASGDLGYAYGTCTPAGGDATKAFGYLRVWRLGRDGTWRVFVDVTP